MREIKYIVVHATATKEDVDKSYDDIERGHKARGFRKIGYHYLILLDGTVEEGRKESEMGAGVRGYNKHSIHLSYVGGLDSAGKPKDTRTDLQDVAMVNTLKDIKDRYPDAEILGHRDLSPDKNKDGKISRWEWIKACPCFDAKEEYSFI